MDTEEVDVDLKDVLAAAVGKTLSAFEFSDDDEYLTLSFSDGSRLHIFAACWCCSLAGGAGRGGDPVIIEGAEAALKLNAPNSQ